MEIRQILDEPDSEDLPDEARNTSESILEHVEEAETEMVDTSEVRISEEEILQDTTIEPEDIAPVDQPPAEPTPAEEEAPIVTEPKQDAVALETEEVSTQPVSVPAPITSARTEPPLPQPQLSVRQQPFHPPVLLFQQKRRCQQMVHSPPSHQLLTLSLDCRW